MIPVSRPSMGKEELEAVGKVFETGWLGLGSTVLEFENKLKEYTGAKNAIAVTNGTAALHIALDGFGVGPGDEVIVPSLTFAATIQAILAVGATPVFCEVMPQTLNVDIKDVENRVTPRTKAIMPVHYCGNACDMDALLKIADARGIKIIEDAAHAFGTVYKGKKIGGFGHCACFSFDAIKNITCGEGGAVLLPDDAIAEKIRRKRVLGIDKDTWARYQNKRLWFYEVVDTGYRYHMSNINAAIGLVQFGKLDKFLARKREITKNYDAAFQNMASVLPLENDHENTAQFCYILRVVKERDAFMEFLKERGAATGVHYIPNHEQPVFKRFAKGPLPVTELLGAQICTLPLTPDMTDADVRTVVDAVTDFDKSRR
ncbi:MAG: DegT/DnrJ/EryC1/StrS aminotransferase family protein [Elusimicrobiales bacterium]|nr:DegT/DnrJ/EryC1/StrS aminotransferase family protein [Elusimicrobiales bacterium]